MDEIASIHYGKALATNQYDDEGQSQVFGTQGIVGRTNLRLFDGPAIIVGRKGTIDRPALIDASRPIWAIDTTFVVRPRSLDVCILHAFLDFIDLAQLNETSGLPSISSETLGTFQLPRVLQRLTARESAAIRLFDHDLELSNIQLRQFEFAKRSLMQKLLATDWHLERRVEASAAPVPELAAGGAP